MKNKNSRLLLILSVFIALMTSCEDFTEFDRGFILAEEGSIDNVSDLERFLLGTYNANGSYAGIVSINSIGTDEVRIGLGNRGQGLQAHSFTLTNVSGEAQGIYNSAYDVIDNANRVLRAADEVTVGDDADLLAQIRGEALAIRAWQYFDLLRMYAPTFDDNSLGVPLVTRVLIVGEDDLSFPRNTVGEVLSQIDEDLEMALTLIPESQSNVNRFSTLAVRALQARVGIYAGGSARWQEAIDAASIVISQRPVVSGDNYINMFRQDPINPDLATTETIFQIERDQFDGRVGTIWSDVNLDVFFSVSIDLLGDLQNGGNDRFNLNIDFEDVITERVSTLDVDDDDILPGKYLGSPELISLNNIKVFRTSEMHLIRAEANARLGNLDAASDDIAALRNVRSSNLPTPDTYANQAEALSDILLERRVELAFEGHRLLDLKRFGQGVDRIDEDCNNGDRPATTCSLDAGNFRFTFPIPQSEIFANDGISDADQNPGY